MTMPEADVSASAGPPPGRGTALPAIACAGFLAGALDLAAACIASGLRGRGPVTVLQAIASGVLGADAFKGGFGTAVLGAFLHFVIATIWAALFFAASRRLRFLTRQAVVSGLAYGVLVHLLMHFVVLPLSSVPFQVSHAPAALARGALIIMFCVGQPIALVVRRFSRSSD